MHTKILYKLRMFRFRNAFSERRGWVFSRREPSLQVRAINYHPDFWKIGLACILLGSNWNLVSGQADSLYEIEKPAWVRGGVEEFAPVPNQGRLVFISNQSTGGWFPKKDEKTQEHLFNYFSVSLNQNGEFGRQTEVYAPELISGSNKGPMILNERGTRMYLTKNIEEPIGNFLRAGNNLGIFEAVLQNGKWNTPVEIAALNVAGYNTCHPALTADGKRMYFCSDRPGGQGGFDLYYSDFERGQWRAPVNLGPEINSKYDEGYVTVNKNGRVYYASNAPDRSIGRKDIFYTEPLKNGWLPPVRLPSPFNTRYNDFYFYDLTNTMDRGYFCSDREDRNRSDVFIFSSRYPTFEEPKPLKKLKLCFSFYEREGVMIDTNLAMYEWDFGDLGKIRALKARMCFPGPGDYTINLNVFDKLTKQVSYQQAVYNFTVEQIEQAWISAPDTAKAGQEVLFSGEESFFKEFAPKGYFWEFGDGNKATGITARHRYSKPGKYKVRLGVSGVPLDAEKPDKFANFKEIVVTD